MMKNTFCLVLLAAMFWLVTSCNQRDPALDQAHQEAIAMTEAMRKTYKGMEEKLEFMKKENEEMADKMKALEQPDSLLVAAVLQTEAIITHYEQLSKSQKKLIEQNEDFLKKHEKSAVTSEEMKAQHQQIALNYETVQTEAAALLQEVEDMKTKHVIVDPNTNGQ